MGIRASGGEDGVDRVGWGRGRERRGGGGRGVGE